MAAFLAGPNKAAIETALGAGRSRLAREMYGVSPRDPAILGPVVTFSLPGVPGHRRNPMMVS
jgi:hypothetical protein